jgi:Zn-dependent protease with chaperone function
MSGCLSAKIILIQSKHMFKVTTLFVYLCTFINIYPTLDLSHPEAQPNFKLSVLKRAIRAVDDFLGREHLGFQAVSASNELFIRKVADSLNMDDYCIEIRGMSNFAQRKFGRINAFVIPSILFSKRSHAYLFISEDWFNTLPDEQKQALVRHELMHIKHNHMRKRLRFFIVIHLLFSFLRIKMPDIVTRSQLVSQEKVFTTSIASMMLVNCIQGFLMLKYSRSCEKEADIKAAKSMHNKQAFIGLFSHMKENIEDPVSKFVIKRFIHRLLKPIKRLLSTHPDFDERIGYIEKLSF